MNNKRAKVRLHDRQLYSDLPLMLTSITDEERIFIKEWCTARNLGENYIVVATTYWLRCKSHLFASFLRFSEAKNLYMILCVHLALKYLGYEEVFKCNFYSDLGEVCPSITVNRHQAMEWELFRTLNFDLRT